MVRFPRSLALVAALATLVTGCLPRERIPNPPEVRTAPAGPGMVPVHGEWVADKATQLRSQPSPGAPVVASIGAGQPVKVVGRMSNSDWIAVQTGGSTAYVRLFQLRLKGSEPSGSRGTTTTLAKPVDNSGPSVKAAPRGKISANPIAN
ncbi:SH3 domain-containing protein [Azospirillum thermophilum]|uniref:SH3 domain-containing protein n=1 Tax=Azospirillum thermophilum TaxID=2202148 RepID=A0A2S2CPC7_9PROT|nr:SH3 domain-containing protein [Azospirillum thermophilum]AWK86220.1 SH3 domain-containing protein [Azospirillum thermophilum]